MDSVNTTSNLRSSINCCFGCENRCLGCHSTCEEYNRQKAEHAAYNERNRQERAKQDFLYNVQVGAKSKKKKGRIPYSAMK
jgi:hypothetical protein